MTLQMDLELYENDLDIQECLRVIWEPCADEILQTLHPICKEGSQLWLAKTLLISFEIAEMHVSY